MTKQNKLRTEVLKRMHAQPAAFFVNLEYNKRGVLVISVVEEGEGVVGEMSVRHFFKKRQPLTGIGKRVAALTRTKVKKKK